MSGQGHHLICCSRAHAHTHIKYSACMWHVDNLHGIGLVEQKLTHVLRLVIVVALLFFPVVRVRLALILVDDLFSPFFITSPVLLPSPPIVSTPLYPSPSFSIPLPLNLSSRSPPISVSVFFFSTPFYPPLFGFTFCYTKCLMNNVH